MFYKIVKRTGISHPLLDLEVVNNLRSQNITC